MTIFILAVTLLFGIVCMLILPDEVAVQWDFSGGVRNTLSKGVAVLISIGCTALCLLFAGPERTNGSLYLAV